MSQRGVERVLGRLATDAEARRRFKRAPERTLRELAALGPELSAGEVEALALLEGAALDRFASGVDPRLRKASLASRDAGERADGL